MLAISWTMLSKFEKFFSQIQGVLYVTLQNWLLTAKALTKWVQILHQWRPRGVRHPGKKPIQLAHCIESYRQNGPRNVLYVTYGIAQLGRSEKLSKRAPASEWVVFETRNDPRCGRRIRRFWCQKMQKSTGNNISKIQGVVFNKISSYGTKCTKKWPFFAIP